MEVVIGLAWWFSQSAAASWRLGLPKRTQVSSGLETFLGKMWLLRSGPTFVSKVSVSGVWTTLLRYGCSRSFSPSDVLRVIDKEECKLGKNTDYQLLQATSRGLRRPRQRDPPMKLPRTTTTTGELFWGYFFVIIGSVSFFGFVFAVIASTLLPLSQNPLNQGLKNDRYYYCFLVPLTIPVITVAVYFHWLSMKLFKHA
ncbi:unnamed protein product [Brassica oleracea]